MTLAPSAPCNVKAPVALSRSSDGTERCTDYSHTATSYVFEQLQARGIEVLLFSGDARATVNNVANALHIRDYRAEALPSYKESVIAELQVQNKVVAFIGDGINDAPALAQADIGLTLGYRADIAIRASSFVLMSNSLDKV